MNLLDHGRHHRQMQVISGESGTDATVSSLDQVNRRAWASPVVLSAFTDEGFTRELDGWTDAGERAAVLAVANAIRTKAALDVGVGAGRTVPFMSLLTDDYVAIDYTPEMVAACTSRFPTVDVRLGDVRDLSDFADASFGFVMFSFNGIDAVGHEDRRLALGEISRVLQPGGVLLYSTHNKGGPCFRAKPWHVAGPTNSAVLPLYYRLGRMAISTIRDPGHFPRSVRNWWHLRSLASDEGDWGVSSVEAHDFGLLIHFSTLEHEQRELQDAGLSLEMAFGCERGQVVSVGSDTSEIRYFHVVARKSTDSALADIVSGADRA